MSEPLTSKDLVVGGFYNWKGQPERLSYIGAQRYNGDSRTWHQFALVDVPGDCWCEVLDWQLNLFEVTERAAVQAAQPEAVGDMVLVPPWKGYALLGTGRYLINHSAEFDPELGAELFITLATDEDRAGDRQIGESRDNREPGKPVQPEDMVLRIGFLSERALFALEDQLRIIRETHFASAPTPEPMSAPTAEPDYGALERDLIAETERAMRQRDEFMKTGVSTAAHGGSHDTCFGHILRKHGIPISQSAPTAEPVFLDHIACIEDGVLRYMSGRKAPAYDCELYAMPGGKSAPPLYLATPPSAATPEPSDAERDVLAERKRQISVEGYNAAEDDEYEVGELAAAGAAYAYYAAGSGYLRAREIWPWGDNGWKPGDWLDPADRRRDLVKSGALILAEIERLDRATKGGKL